MNASNDFKTNTPIHFTAAILVALAALTVIALSYALTITTPAPQVAHTASLASGTEGLLKQTALHLSKMQGGESIGGFPGFEPPDDDEKYKRKIKNSSASGEEVNTWVKEINNFLRQVANKNPGMTLEKILEKQGLSAEQVKNFSDALRNVHAVADGKVGYGVRQTTFDSLTELMKLLGVTTW
ncbi:MAG: hypothetical protein AABZ78_15825 [Chloroflexota bacterium]